MRESYSNYAKTNLKIHKSIIFRTQTGHPLRIIQKQEIIRKEGGNEVNFEPNIRNNSN